jgi:dihydroxyacetone kinase-like protein
MRLDILEKVCNIIIENKEVLTELDRVIGDGDHGVNLSRGMEKVKEEIPKLDALKPFEVLNKCAMLLMSNVGGASGALYATALMKGAAALKGKEDITTEDIVKTWNEMILGIESRGKSTKGEKTMLDTLIPAYEAFKAEVEATNDLKSAFSKAEQAGKLGMKSTKDMVATKGRATYLGDRSVGHIDAGATSSYLIIKTIAESI